MTYPLDIKFDRLKIEVWRYKKHRVTKSKHYSSAESDAIIEATFTSAVPQGFLYSAVGLLVLASQDCTTPPVISLSCKLS